MMDSIPSGRSTRRISCRHELQSGNSPSTATRNTTSKDSLSKGKETASAFVKDASACLENIQYGFSSTSMKIEEEVTEGSVHVGELIAGDEDHGWKKPLVEIDENYAGTFKISKKMGVSTCCPEDGPGEDWLSCCTGGYGHMDDDDKLWGEEEIFGCTCRDVAWGDSWTYKLKEQPL